MRRLIRIQRRTGLIIAMSFLAWLPSLAAAQQLQSAEAPPLSEDERRPAELNVSIAVFDPGVPIDPSSHRRLQIFPRIREIEALFLPFVLRETLVETNQWGAVRVVPEPDIAAELLISGAIIRSDGETLELQVRAIDSTGRVWINKAYSGLTGADAQQDAD